MPADIRVTELTRNQQDDLNRLKGWIYERRIKARKDHDRDERRERKETEVAEKKELQPALFDL